MILAHNLYENVNPLRQLTSKWLLISGSMIGIAIESFNWFALDSPTVDIYPVIYSPTITIASNVGYFPARYSLPSSFNMKTYEYYQGLPIRALFDA